MGSGWNSATAQSAGSCGAGEGCALRSPHPVPSEIDFSRQAQGPHFRFPVSTGAFASAPDGRGI
jgi:hypothetical protein